MASAALEQAMEEAAVGRTDRVTERMHRGYANLHEALFDAHTAAAAARSLTSRALGRLGRGS